MQKVYVKKQCMSKEKGFLDIGNTPDLDKTKDKILWDLKLVEDYDTNKHGLAKDSLEDKVTELETKVASLEVENKALDGFVKKAIGSAKGTVPVGYGV
jgi:hypothetical protein